MRLIILILTIGVGWSVGSIVGMDRAIKNMKELQDYIYEPNYFATSSASAKVIKVYYQTTTPNK